MNLSITRLIAILFFFFVIQLGFAQKPETINIGTKHSLYSDVLKQDRPYSVYLPNSYSENGNPVSVVYLLDGNFHFHHTSGILNFLEQQGRIPPTMLVAIPNTDNRTRDLTPPIIKNPESAKNYKDPGEANNMLSFLEKELIPEINKKYNTNEYKILIGHSFGGIMAQEIASFLPVKKIILIDTGSFSF